MVLPVERGFEQLGGTLTLRRRPDIFISHNSHDKPFVRNLVAELTKIGVDAWLDEWELEAGDSLHRSIGVALEKSRFVGIVISPKFTSSEWCMDELAQALARERRQNAKVVIPLMYEEAIAPPFIEDRLYINFSKDFFGGIAELGQIVHNLNRALFKQTIARRAPRSIAEVWQLLADCGCDRASLFDAKDIELLKARLDMLGIKYKLESNGSLWLDEDVIFRHKHQLDDLAVVQTLLELFEKSDYEPLSEAELLHRLSASLSSDNVTALMPEVFQLAKLHGVSLSEIGDRLGFALGTVSRWASGNTKPHKIIAIKVIETILELIAKKTGQHVYRNRALRAD